MMGRHGKNFEVQARNGNVRGDSGKVSGGNESQVIGNWRKDDSYYQVANTLAEL